MTTRRRTRILVPVLAGTVIAVLYLIIWWFFLPVPEEQRVPPIANDPSVGR